jgi:Domain of unknown function (DUF4304)
MSDTIPNILNDELVALGFKRKATYWYRASNDVIHVVGLQKSRWGEQHYLNLAVWVSKIEKRDFPKVRECHIQCRLDAFPETPDDLSRALDEEDSWKIDADTRREIIKLSLCNAEFLFFRELGSFESTKRYLKGNPDPRCAVTQSLKAII